MKKIFLLSLLIFLGCCYKKDKLKVFNESSIDIHYLPMLYDLDKKCFLALSVGSNIKQGEYSSPYLRNPASEYLKIKGFDSFLYLIFFKNKNDDSALSDGIKKIPNDKRFKVQKYSLNQLDSLNWTITYKGKHDNR